MVWLRIVSLFLIVLLCVVIAKYLLYKINSSAIKGGCDHPNCPCGKDCACVSGCQCVFKGSKKGGDCGCGCGRNVIFISGADGVGKTTIGKKLVERLNKKEITATLIDQDDYIEKSIDWPKFNMDLEKARKENKYTIVVGSKLWKDHITETPDRHFLLENYLGYQKTLNKLGKHTNFPVFSGPGIRRNIDDITTELCQEIETIVPGVPPSKEM